jgi:serine/threonine protein kinase
LAFGREQSNTTASNAHATDAPASVNDVKVAVQESPQHFQDVYKLQEELGKGAFSTVYRGIHKRTGQKYAVKVVKEEGLPKDDEEALHLEVEILQGMDHPHIIRLYQFFDEQKHYYLVTELMEGGELFDRIVQKVSNAVPCTIFLAMC